MAGQGLSSMFVRRLVLMGGLFVVATGVIVLQLGRLTSLEHDEHRAALGNKLVRTHWEPTVRGRILDRHGRVLARAVAGYRVAVAYEVLSGAWADQQGLRAARRVHADRWDELDPAARDALAADFAGVYREHAESMWPLLARELEFSEEELARLRLDIIERIERMHATIVERRRQSELRELAERGQPVTDDVLERIERLARQPIREQSSPHTLTTAVDDETAFALTRLGEESVRLTLPGGNEDWVPIAPGLVVLDSGDRDYPFESVVVDVDLGTLPSPLRGEGRSLLTVEGVATHLIGWTRSQVQEQDEQTRAEAVASDPRLRERVMAADGVDRGRYLAGDEVGAVGIEASQELVLRGLRGRRTLRLDSERVDIEPPVPGEDVRLTIDVMLQARVHAAMAGELGLASVQDWHGSVTQHVPLGTTLPGAAVILDVDTGEILSMVSMPSFTRAQLQQSPERVFEDPIDAPWLNRAIARPYPPGSISKALVIAYAQKMGVLEPGERIACTGHLLPHNNTVYRCWIYRRNPGVTHSLVLGVDPDAREALMASCNIFFYELGRRLGLSRMVEVYQQFGLGERFDLGIGSEFEGAVGLGGDPTRLESQDAILLAIGQGPVIWTPLHAASAYATIARGGVRVEPTLIDDGRPPRRRSLDLPSGSIEDALAGLALAVNDPQGTGHHLSFVLPDGRTRTEPIFNAPGVRVWGKTGTAQASPLVVDPDGPEGPINPEVVRRGEHSWFVALVGRDRPRYAIAVVMEYAGSGGRVSGPICNQIIHALVAEGYL